MIKVRIFGLLTIFQHQHLKSLKQGTPLANCQYRLKRFAFPRCRIINFVHSLSHSYILYIQAKETDCKKKKKKKKK